MYINDLGIGRIASDHSVKAGSTIRRKDTDRYADYAAVMKKAVDRQATTVNPAFTTVDDIIIREAFAKMESDPEWEKTVMNKVKEYYTGDRAAGSTQNRYQTLPGQNVLQNYMLQNLIGGMGLGSSTSSFYGNSLFGDWML